MISLHQYLTSLHILPPHHLYPHPFVDQLVRGSLPIMDHTYVNLRGEGCYILIILTVRTLLYIQLFLVVTMAMIIIPYLTYYDVILCEYLSVCSFILKRDFILFLTDSRLVAVATSDSVTTFTLCFRYEEVH